MLGAALGGESHVDGDVLLGFLRLVVTCADGVRASGHGFKADGVDEAEIDDVDRNLRVVAAFQRA